ncbi:hypothetical protein G6720_04145 [Polynucleobacter paneuropaeus]|nr:hypothetical protein G6720_04145 [Polynucleobacter paneuropaeus]
MNFSQIYISDQDSDLPPYLKGCQDVAKNLISHNSYQLYDNESLKAFIVKHFDAEVADAFDMLNPYSYKSDLGRFCLLFVLGGWYLDIAIKPLLKIEVPSNVDLLAFREINRVAGASWGMCTGALYSRPNNPIFLMAIKMIVENCKNEYYGFNAICPTGPNLLGRAFAILDSVRNMMLGDVVFLTPGYQNPNKSMVLPSGDIFAHFKPSGGGDLVSLGSKGVNNYNDFYSSRTVYKK